MKNSRIPLTDFEDKLWQLFSGLTGSWRLERQINDGSLFSGTAEFSRMGDVKLLLEEAGWLTKGGQRYEATRKWYWEFLPGDRITVYFGEPDAKVYHDLAFEQKAGTWLSSAEHLCGEDLYKGSYRLHSDMLEVQQTIKGPAKDLVLNSRYFRS